MEKSDPNLRLMDLHLEALFVHDERGRMVRVNVAENIEPPCFFLGRTPAGVVVRFSAGLPNETVERLSELSTTEPCDLAIKDPVHMDEYLKILEEHSPIKGVWHEQAFVFPEDPGTSADSEVELITVEATDLLLGGFEEWLGDVAEAQPFTAVVEDGHAVSLCASVRITPRAHECGIETIPDRRGHGLAARAASAWAVQVSKLGLTPLYSTYWDNAASQRVAAKLRCYRFGSDFYVA